MPRKDLPHGDWLTLVNLPTDVTEADIQELFFHRTGVQLPEEHIQISDPLPGKNTSGALISLNRFHVKALIEWAFAEDTIGGRQIRFLLPDRRN